MNEDASMQTWMVNKRLGVDATSVTANYFEVDKDSGALVFVRYGELGEELKVAAFPKDVWLEVEEIKQVDG